MAELRWNPLLGNYTMVANNRQNRPNMPKGYCPFCPGSGKVPEDYEVYLYPNDFPALSQQPPKPDLESDELYQTAPNYGQCDVILFSPDHNASLYDLSIPHLKKLIQLWADRTEVLAEDSKIKYIFPFENRGAAVGVTMPHPHGQIYGYPFVPLKLQTELDNAKAHYEKTGRNLFDDMIEKELAFEKRVILENDNFLACLPFFTDYPFGVFIIQKTVGNYLYELNEKAQTDLAAMLKTITKGFDNVYNKRFPYMMCIHQAAINTDKYAAADDYFRLHIEFYPPWRADGVIKYYASSEMGAWAAANTMAVEDSAIILREAISAASPFGY